jgi:hypothetical protein
MLPAISSEQQLILNNIVKYNVVVDAVAGSGKTTTILHIAKQYPDLNILLVTYNSRLKLETREKCETLNLLNLEVHSYHSFCGKYLGMESGTDQAIKKRLLLPVNLPKNQYQIIIIDEAQDMDDLYYKLISHVVQTNDAKIIILGDVYQNIYQYRGATDKYIRNPALYFQNNYEWRSNTLQTSYRLTKNMTSFLNDCVLQQDRIIAVKNKNIPISYLYIDPYKAYQHIKKYVKDNIFILTPSVKIKKTTNNSPIANLAKEFEKHKIHYHRPESDDTEVTEEQLKNKVPILSFHQSKGLERDVVVIFNFDASYFQFYGKDYARSICPNILYVALTRAKERLIIINDVKQEPLEFLNMSKMQMANYLEIIGRDFQKEIGNNILGEIKRIKKFCETFSDGSFDYLTKINETNLIVKKIMDHNLTDDLYETLRLCYQNLLNFHDQLKKYKIPKCINISVTELISHTGVDTIYNARKCFSIKNIKKADEKIKVPNEIKNMGITESVSTINGIAMQSYYEFCELGSLTIFTELKLAKDEIKKRLHIAKIYDFDYLLNNNLNLNAENLLKLSALYEAYCSGYYNKLSQIKNFNWLTDDILAHVYNRIQIIGKIKETDAIELPVQIITGQIIISGRIDFIINNTVWEIKFVDSIKDEHFIQLACYAYLRGKDVPHYLYNVKTNEIWEITFHFADLKNMMQILVYDKHKIQYEDGFQFIKEIDDTDQYLQDYLTQIKI